MKNELEFSRTSSWSLAFKLTAYYSVSSFITLLLATGYLYWAMQRNLDLEDDRLLSDRVRLLHSILLNDPLDLQALRQEVDEAPRSGQSNQIFIRIFDSAQQVICQTKNMDEILPSAVFPKPSETTGIGVNARLQSGATQRVMSVNLGTENDRHRTWVVQVGMDRSEEEEILDDYRQNLILVLIASLLICAFVGYQITHRGIRPLHNITTVVSSTQPSNLSERLDSTGLPKELQILVTTFNAMMDRLEQAFDRLSRFTTDIAHELRTPLNYIRGELDLVITKPRSVDEYEEAIGSCLEETERLSRTIENLLFLARAENPQTQIERESINLESELLRIREFFDATAQEAGVSLKIEVPTGLVADVDRNLLQQALGNLVTNALAHTSGGGNVTIRAYHGDANVTIEVDDTGCGIAERHLPHLLDRFYRAEETTKHHRGGLGLGLSIVKSIVELHGGTIQITSELGKGSSVRLKFPNQLSSASRTSVSR